MTTRTHALLASLAAEYPALWTETYNRALAADHEHAIEARYVALGCTPTERAWFRSPIKEGT